jgi:hypothetical protein
MWCPRLFAELKPCPRRVELEDRQHDVVETKGGESVVEHQTRRLGAVTLAPVLGLADKNAESGRTVAVIYAVQTGVTYRLQRLPFVDSKRHVVFRLRLPVVPVLFLLARHGKRREPQRAHRAEVIHPTLVEWQQVTL